MIIQYGPFILAATLSIATAYLVDLLKDFSTTTIKNASLWVGVYLFVNAFSSILVLLGLMSIDIKIQTISINNWTKAILAGIFLPSILKSRIFMWKIGQTKNRHNPEQRYQQIMNVLKSQIARTGLPDSFTEIQKYLNCQIEELRDGAYVLTCIDELWNDDNQPVKYRTILKKWQKLSLGEEKKLLSGFILEKCRGRNFDKLLSIKSRLKSLELVKLNEIIEGSESIKEEDLRYYNDLYNQFNAGNLNEDTLKDYLKEFIYYNVETSQIISAFDN
jgi:uncharacterized protein (UPF0147 family)